MPISYASVSIYTEKRVIYLRGAILRSKHAGDPSRLIDDWWHTMRLIKKIKQTYIIDLKQS